MKIAEDRGFVCMDLKEGKIRAMTSEISASFICIFRSLGLAATRHGAIVGWFA